MKTKCPICGRPPEPAAAPFCSRGCKDRDLLQWLGEGYRIPGPAIDRIGDGADGLDSATSRD
ncbi:DNA gyrase inhibitor YacG [Sphingomonas sp. TZW2008]|uniref:DNA gyrase inhibitor YacG n=1 Tax=Sphingomonas sp. TZW2008 TaxID=1917973 RepID=UPI000A26A762|nr:DNA gyrase inhibitor YacG [Sphingomonas sp. TZW2008]